MRRRIVIVAVTAALGALVGCGDGAGGSAVPAPSASQRITVTSTAFTEGGTVPRRYTCDGEDVSLPETMKRSMARQAEADRERRARIINADAELQASKKLAEAAKQMSEQPAALQLRLLQTVVAVAAEKNSTLVLPFPEELLRFLERAQSAPPPPPPPPPPAVDQ